MQALNALALAKEQTSEQRGLLNSALSAPVKLNVTYDHDGGTATSPVIYTADQGTEQALHARLRPGVTDLDLFFETAATCKPSTTSTR